MAETLTKIERQVLAHLPAWAADEAWHVENEGGPRRQLEDGTWTGSIRSYSLPDFAVRLAEDVSTQHPQRGGPLTEAECGQVLEHLASRGFAAFDVEADAWRMTQLGFETITGPANEPEQIPGPVTVPLNPAIHTSAAGMGQ